MPCDALRGLAHAQAGLATRAQLRALGIERWSIGHRVRRGTWQQLSPTVVAMLSGELSAEQRLWLGVLHAGRGAVIGELVAAAQWGLRNWERTEVVVHVPHDRDVPSPLPGFEFRRSRRALDPQTRSRRGLPLIRLEPAVLTWASRQRSRRAAEGILAASVQQRLTTASALTEWVDRLSPLAQAARFRRVLREIDGGAQSTAELDVRQMCRTFGLAAPRRQVQRRDAHGRLRYTDCEWLLADGRLLVLEVDGAFHMTVEQWEDDIVRQRALTDPGRVVVRCTARELRDEPDRLASDLRALGVPTE